MYSGFMNHAVPLWVLYVNKRSTNVSHLVNTQNAIMAIRYVNPSRTICLRIVRPCDSCSVPRVFSVMKQKLITQTITHN